MMDHCEATIKPRMAFQWKVMVCLYWSGQSHRHEDKLRATCTQTVEEETPILR